MSHEITSDEEGGYYDEEADYLESQESGVTKALRLVLSYKQIRSP